MGSATALRAVRRAGRRLHLPAPPKPLTPPHNQTARLAVEKRKKGKVVTVVRGLPADQNDLRGLLGQLKAACGAGGTVKDDELEI